MRLTPRPAVLVAAIAVLALTSVACDNWWFVKGQVVVAACDSKQKSSTIVEKDSRWLDNPTYAGVSTLPPPVSGAQVEMVFRIDHRSPFEEPNSTDVMTTDGEGWFEQEEVYGSPDRFGLRVTAPGYQSVQGVFLIKHIAPTPQAFAVTLRPVGC